ncbi:MAG: phage holin family protein [Bacilli bacterium]|nr:phage holin family protein [Bacilli bacterium]
MKKIFNDRNINKFLDWLIYIIAYTLTFFLVDILFNAFEVDNPVYYFVASLIMYGLNIAIRPIVFRLTLPLIGYTYGLFYFVIDFLMLLIIDFVLSRHFDIYGMFWGLFIAFVISITHVLIEEIILKPLAKGSDKK